jgi:hypothetical protein
MKTRTSWHPAFFGAIQLELNEYRDVLEFQSEHQLTSEPLKIDVVIIKKLANIAIQKNIARIFQNHNIVEYKSPSASVSINDYYKIQGCCWLYAAFENINVDDTSITMVITKRPQKLLNYLKHRFGIRRLQSGIYLVENNVIPTQIVVSSELPETENLWLTSLNRELKPTQFEQVTTKITSYEKNPAVTAFWEVVVGANFQTFQKLMETKDMKTFTQQLKETGLFNKWFPEEFAEAHAQGLTQGLAQGLAEGLAQAEAKRQADKIEMVRNLKKLGVPCETIAEASGLPLNKVKQLK